MHKIRKTTLVLVTTLFMLMTNSPLHATAVNPYDLKPIETTKIGYKKLLKGANRFWEVVDLTPIPPLRSFRKRNVVLTWGEIGCGKTTAAYYLAGETFSKKGNTITAKQQAVNQKIEGAYYDKTRMFELIHPVQRKDYVDWYYVDFPGFVNMGRQEQQLYNALACRFCLSRVASVQAIIFVLEHWSNRAMLRQVRDFYQNDLTDFLSDKEMNTYRAHLFCLVVKFQGDRKAVEQKVRDLFKKEARNYGLSSGLAKLFNAFAAAGHTIAIDPCDDAQAAPGKTTRDKVENFLMKVRKPLTPKEFNLDFFSKGHFMQQISNQIHNHIKNNEIITFIREKYYQKHHAIIAARYKYGDYCATSALCSIIGIVGGVALVGSAPKERSGNGVRVVGGVLGLAGLALGGYSAFNLGRIVVQKRTYQKARLALDIKNNKAAIIQAIKEGIDVMLTNDNSALIMNRLRVLSLLGEQVYSSDRYDEESSKRKNNFVQSVVEALISEYENDAY